MDTDDYKQGTVKVVWVEKDLNKIYSMMFKTEKEANEFAKLKLDYLIFTLEYQENMKEFCWRLLPFGRYKLYLSVLKTFKFSENNLLKVAKQFFK